MFPGICSTFSGLRLVKGDHTIKKILFKERMAVPSFTCFFPDSALCMGELFQIA